MSTQASTGSLGTRAISPSQKLLWVRGRRIWYLQGRFRRPGALWSRLRLRRESSCSRVLSVSADSIAVSVVKAPSAAFNSFPADSARLVGGSNCIVAYGRASPVQKSGQKSILEGVVVEFGVVTAKVEVSRKRCLGRTVLDKKFWHQRLDIQGAPDLQRHEHCVVTVGWCRPFRSHHSNM